MARKDITRGRALEKHVAGLFGRRRLYGSMRGCDVTEHEGQKLFPIGLECKSWDTLQLRQSWIDQAKKNAAREGRPWWAVVQRPKGSGKVYATIDLELLLHLCRLAARLDPAWSVAWISNQTREEESDGDGLHTGVRAKPGHDPGAADLPTHH